jgi:PAS domain S-box-containing protein
VGAVVSDLIDYRGNTVVKNELRTLQDQKEALLKYQLENNDTSLFSRKVVLLKKYTPLNLYIGEVIYLEDFTSDLKNYIIDMLAKIRFGEEGYLFVNTTAGYALIKDGEIVEDPVNIWNLTDPNGVKVIQQEYKAAQKPNGDYIYYSWRKLNSDKIAKKVSYVRGVEAFDWMIGAGSYLDDINNRIAQAEKGLYNNMLRDVLLLAGIFIVLLIAGYYIVKRYVVAEQEQLKLFTDYFKRRGFDNQLLDTSHIYYSEFKTMSEAVNSMMKKNREMTGQIKNDRLLLRYLVDAIPDSITYKNTNFEYVGCNKAFEKTFGISLERMKYIKVADLFEPEVVTVIEEMEAELFRQRQPIRRMVWIKDRDNTNIRMEVTKTFYYDQNENILGIITINRPYYLEKETATS